MNQPEGIRKLEDMLAECERRSAELTAKVAEQQKYERDLLQRMYLDEKTGFPNHASLYRDCRHLFSASATSPEGAKSAIIFIALDETFEILKKSQVSIVSEWVLYKIAHWSSGFLNGGDGYCGHQYQSNAHHCDDNKQTLPTLLLLALFLHKLSFALFLSISLTHKIS